MVRSVLSASRLACVLELDKCNQLVYVPFLTSRTSSNGVRNVRQELVAIAEWFPFALVAQGPLRKACEQEEPSSHDKRKPSAFGGTSYTTAEEPKTQNPKSMMSIFLQSRFARWPSHASF
ncbi:unnamed protein product [Effrenium voratum]|uniref:Uncharacterized protein n=1 Tax=Effrenium voratum TaxID=2562239 RepID=A0AA36JTY9_9DINO|nr:unnamed protein product [Effrenium voratum]